MDQKKKFETKLRFERSCQKRMQKQMNECQQRVDSLTKALKGIEASFDLT